MHTPIHPQMHKYLMPRSETTEMQPTVLHYTIIIDITMRMNKVIVKGLTHLIFTWLIPYL